MEISPEQEEELEVLISIFEGDDAFNQIAPNEFQYKIGENGSNKSFLLTIKWPEGYPACKPEINLDSFYNKHIVDEVKQNIVASAYEQAEALLGDAVTYTIIDWAKENAELLMADLPETAQRSNENSEATTTADDLTAPKKKEKKEQLSKAQKRKLAGRLDASGERPRGWDWVEVVKHLSQTGRAEGD